MFDIGFSEMLLIGVVALVVIGPEKLPGVARTIGHLLGRAQRYVNDVKSDINREMQLEELKKLQSQMNDSVREIEQSVKQEVDTARTSVDTVLQEFKTEAVLEQPSLSSQESPQTPPVESTTTAVKSIAA